MNFRSMLRVILSVCCCGTALAEFRVWSGLDGSVVEAEMIMVANGNVSLRTRDGKVLRVPVSKLSKADVTYVEGEDEKEADEVTFSLDPIVHLAFDDPEALGKNLGVGRALRTKTLGWSPDGRKGGAALFNGRDSAVNLERSVPMKDQPFTIAVWLKTNSDEYQQIFSYGAQIKGCCIYTDGNSLGVVYRWKHGVCFKEFSSSKVKAKSGEWLHACVTVDRGGTVTLYGNGIKLLSRNVELLEANPSSLANLAQPSPVFKQEGVAYFNGALDDFLWFDVALSEEQVQLLFSSYP